jgi:alpha-mannosidase
VTKERIKQFIDRELREKLILSSKPLKSSFLKGDHPSGSTAAKASGWVQIEPGFHWGGAYEQGWYKVNGSVPKKEGVTPVLMYGRPEIQFNRDGMVEGTLWIKNRIVGGLDFGHQYFRLDGHTQQNGRFEILCQTYAHNKECVVHGWEQPRTPEPERFDGFLLAELDEARLALFFDCEFAFSLYEGLEESSPAAATVLRGLNDVCNAYRPDSNRTWTNCRRILRDALGSLSGDIDHTITACGHAHLDTAWLWPLSVTHLKMAHTTAVQLDLMDRYPEHVFCHSQASQYEWLEEQHPELLDRVQKAIKKGQWEPVGSMWVEADCNLTGSEALVRQFLYGRRWFEQKTGVVTDDMWLPDVFGYSAALPQILNKFNIKSFLTQKLSWNQYNKIPHHTFWWEGIDGSKIWTHFPPADTYIASMAPKEILESVKKYKDHGRCDHSMMLYGWGDGGGGPTEFHLERARRARNAPCMPEIRRKKHAADFFEDARAASSDLCTWKGELYFELHRGTFTSQAKNKQENRICEFLLRDAELLACFRDDFPRKYPADQLEKAWKLVLLNQFHDIIPGSSVREVYEDSDRDYEKVHEIVEPIIESSLRKIGQKLDTTGMEKPYALFHNSTIPSQAEIPWTKKSHPQSMLAHEEIQPVQLVNDFGGKKLIFQSPNASLGAPCVADLSSEEPYDGTRLKASTRRLENDQWSVKFDANGNITSIKTLEDEPIEFIQAGALANVFQIFDDHPTFWDAWDVEIYSLEDPTDLTKSDSVELVEKGPVRAAIEIVRTFGKSKIRQKISLGPTPGIRFDTWVDWHEDNKMLKVAFPMNINAMRASFEIQFGHVERPTHSNTSWDLAKFEVPHQKWFDLSEGGYGAALLNTGKYGCDVIDSTMRLTLLRSPKAPDPICDMGEHHFTYVLLPHYDQVVHSEVVQAAYAINSPVRYAELKATKGAQGVIPPLCDVSSRSIVVESVKKAEDSENLIVRLYECHNTRGRADLCCAVPIKGAWLTDLNEEPIRRLEVDESCVRFDYKPFEIITVMIKV